MGNKQAPQSSKEAHSDAGKTPTSDPAVNVTGFVVCQPGRNSDENDLLRQLMKFEDNPVFSKLIVNINKDNLTSRGHVDHCVVKTIQIAALLKQQQHGRESEAWILQRLSATYCKRQVEERVPVWLSPKRQMAPPSGATGYYNPEIPHHTTALSKFAFGTFDRPCRFKYLFEATSCPPSSIYQVEFHFDNEGTMQLYCEYTIEDDDDGECRQLYRLEFPGRSLHRIVHVADSKRSVDAFFQMKHPPLIYELIDEERTLWSRRSRLPFDMTRDDAALGRCDVVRLSFDVEESSASNPPSDVEIIYRNLQSRINRPKWDFRFTHVQQKLSKTSSSRDAVGPFDLSYPKAVLYSVGLRGQLLLQDNRFKALHDAEKLFHVAERYDKDSQYYLIDVDRVLAGDRKERRRSVMRHVILTPTRVIFKRPPDSEKNRIFRNHGADSAMKVMFRDEDIECSGTNLQNIGFHKDCDGNVDDEVCLSQCVLHK